MGKRLYVGNLPYDVTEDQLHSLFAPFGAVESAKLILDKMSGRSKGFGFVEMASEPEAQEAIQKMNGAPVGGRPATVSEARPMENRRPSLAGGGGRSETGGRW